MTGSLQAGDFIKLASDTDAKYYEIQSVNSLNQVTLTVSYGCFKWGFRRQQICICTYQNRSFPSTLDTFYSDTEACQLEDIFWLCCAQIMAHYT